MTHSTLDQNNITNGINEINRRWNVYNALTLGTVPCCFVAIAFFTMIFNLIGIYLYLILNLPIFLLHYYYFRKLKNWYETSPCPKCGNQIKRRSIFGTGYIKECNSCGLSLIANEYYSNSITFKSVPYSYPNPPKIIIKKKDI